MRVQMRINGKDAGGLGLTCNEGTLNALMKPAQFKKMISNQNSSAHGTSYLTDPSKRFLAEQDIAIPVYLRAESLIDTQRRMDDLVEFLKNGVESNSGYTGINEIYVPCIEKTFRLIYKDITKFGLFSIDGGVLMSIKFTEFDPSNRANYNPSSSLPSVDSGTGTNVDTGSNAPGGEGSNDENLPGFENSDIDPADPDPDSGEDLPSDDIDGDNGSGND